jgi:DNA-binding CsgD family transcriptional regulator
MVDILITAAQDAAAVAPTVALELLHQADAMLDPHDRRRWDIEVAALEPRARSGDIKRARADAEALLLRCETSEQRGRVHAALAAVSATAGDLKSATRHYGTADGGAGLDAVERCLAVGQRILVGDEPGDGLDELEHIVATTDDRHVSCAAFQGLALAAGSACRFRDATILALESFRRFDPRTMPRAGFLMPDVWIGSFDAFADRFDEAATVFERVGYEAERRGETATLGQTSAALGLLALFNGRWDDARREFDTVLSIARETGARAHVLSAHAGLAAIAFRSNDLPAARSHLSAGHDALREGLHLFGVDLLVWLTATDGFRSRGLAATFPPLFELWEQTATMRGLTQFRSIAPDLVKAARAAQKFDRAQAVAMETEDMAERCGVPSVVAAALRCRGLLDDEPDMLVAAADRLAETPWHLDHAWACQDAADVLAGAGDEARSRAMAERSATAFARLRAGASTSAAQPSPTSATTVPGDVWATVSPRELEVVQLVASGASNPEIATRLHISRRTVESHVSSAMRKLGAANRTQIATIAAHRPTIV